MPNELARELFYATQSDAIFMNRLSREQVRSALAREFATGRLVAWMSDLPADASGGSVSLQARSDAADHAAAAAEPAADTSPAVAGTVGQGRVPHRNPPKELVTLQGINRPGSPKRIQLEKATATAYQRLVAHARRDGFAEPLFLIVSGYRDQNRQAELYAEALKRYGSAHEARKWVAPPGHSAHGTGCAVDLWLGFPCAKAHNASIKGSAAYKWMKEHASEHGFNPYELEGWHWEYYVGD